MKHALVVFTDLDGTLLDHQTYDFGPAMPALRALRRLAVPLVMASSKTAAEVAPLRAELGFDHVPAIVENGAGLLPAGAGAMPDRADYLRLRAALDRLPRGLRGMFRGFGDLGPDGIRTATGLDDTGARRASMRAYSEPGLWQGSPEAFAQFRAALAEKGITCRQGGRFATLSFGAGKGDQVSRVLDLLGGAAHTLALGDAPNDIELLEAAGHGVIVANPHGTPVPALAGEASGGITRSALPGPAGWNAAVRAHLAKLELDTERKLG